MNAARTMLRGLIASPVRALCWVTGVALIVNSALFTIHYHYPVAFWDFWNWIEDFRRYAGGRYHVIDLFDQHNEHRIFTTRLFLFADALLDHMRGRIPVAANFLITAGLGLALARLAGGMRREAAIPGALVAALMVSLCNWENLVGPFQIQYALMLSTMIGAAACLSVAAGADKPPARRAAWFSAGIGCFSLSCFSMAGGVLGSAPLLLLLWLRGERRRMMALFAAFSCAITWLYFHHYVPTGGKAAAAVGLGARLLFAARFTGAAFSAFGPVPLVAGLATATAAAAMLVVLSRRRWLGLGVRPGDAALLAVAGFTLANAAAAAVNRAGLGTNAALEPRYASISLVAMTSVAALTVRYLVTMLPARSRPVASLPAALCALAITMLLNAAPAYRHDAADRHTRFAAAGAALRANVDDGVHYSQIDYKTASDRAGTLRFLHDARLNMFAPVYDPPAWVADRLRAETPDRLPRCLGAVRSVRRLSATRLWLDGWLADATGRGTAQWVALSGTAGAARPALADVRRKDIRRALHLREASGFDAGFALPGAAPDGRLWLIGLFADDAARDCVFALQDVPLDMVRDLPVGKPGRLATLASRPVVASTFRLGADPGAHLAPPWPATPFVSTSAAGDAATGSASAEIRWDGGADQSLFLPFATGPDTGGQLIAAVLADGTRLEAGKLPATPLPVWRAFVLDGRVIAAHGGGTVRLYAQDEGSGWGEWLAVSLPVIGTADQDAGRLY